MRTLSNYRLIIKVNWARWAETTKIDVIYKLAAYVAYTLHLILHTKYS